MLADAVVDTLVVTAENHQVFLAGELIGEGLRQLFAVGRGEDDLVVRALGLELFHQVENRFDHHDHAGIAAETVVVGLAVAALAVIADVVDVDFDQALVLGPFHDGVVQRAFQKLRNDGQDIYSHTDGKFSDYL